MHSAVRAKYTGGEKLGAKLCPAPACLEFLACTPGVVSKPRHYLNCKCRLSGEGFIGHTCSMGQIKSNAEFTNRNSEVADIRILLR